MKKYFILALLLLPAGALAQGGDANNRGGKFGNGRGMSGSCICGDGSYMNLHTGVTINSSGATTSGPLGGSGASGGAVDAGTGQVNGGGTGSADGGLTAGGPR